MDEDLLAEHVEALHGVPLDAFVRERDARARQLRADGHREEAAALGRQRKPTVVAWAVNQLPRRHPEAVDELIDAGRALHAAQVRATSGRGADGLRRASGRVRDLVRELADRAGEVLEDAGSAPHDAEVEQTLFATATDQELRDTLRRGVLGRAVEVSGFGPLAALAAVPDAETPSATADDGQDDHDAAEEEARAREEAKRQARRRELEAQRADLQRARVRQQRRVQRQRSRVDDLEARLAQLEDEVAEARATAEAASAELTSLDEELAAVEEALAGGDEG